jgi:uncharacterized protein (DUF488 family)
MEYVFLGVELGGRPPEANCYDQTGFVLYWRVAQLARFREGIATLKASAAHGPRTVVMCSEEDPSGCHRHLLVGRVLVSEAVRVIHLRHDGSKSTYEELAAAEGMQSSLFGDSEESSWRSRRSVSRSDPRKISSGN